MDRIIPHTEPLSFFLRAQIQLVCVLNGWDMKCIYLCIMRQSFRKRDVSLWCSHAFSLQLSALSVLFLFIWIVAAVFLHSDVSSLLPLCFHLLFLFKWRKERGFSFRGVTRCVNGSGAERSWQPSSTRGPGERRVGSAAHDCSVLVWTCRKETQQGMFSVMNGFTSDGGCLWAFHTFPLVLKAVLLSFRISTYNHVVTRRDRSIPFY